MKYPYPPKATQREIVYRLRMFFKTEEVEFFNAALNLFFSYYEEPIPKVEWYLRMDDSAIAGLTYDNGKIDLIAPEAWKKRKKYKTQRRWIEVCFHELYHYLFWVDDERKAEEFAEGFVKI